MFVWWCGINGTIDIYLLFSKTEKYMFFSTLSKVKKKLLSRFVKRPPQKNFLFMILIWVGFSFIFATMYDPVKEISGVWWLFTFLLVDGMVVCLFLPYKGIFKFIIWYMYVSMVMTTIMLFVVFISVVDSYMRGEFSMLYTYKNESESSSRTHASERQ